MESLSDAYFMYKGKRSSDFGLRIYNEMVYVSPEADIEFVPVIGRDGELAIDNKRFESGRLEFPVKLELTNQTVAEATHDISNWLKNDINWHKLYYSEMPEYVFEAMFFESFNVNRTLKNRGKTVLNFKLKPKKYLIDGENIQLEMGTTLFNPEGKSATPLIHVEGSGNINFQNNGEDWLMLKDVVDEITIDSEMMSVYKGESPEFYKMIGTLDPLFPELAPGKNKITWSGNVNKVTVRPRWEAIL